MMLTTAVKAGLPVVTVTTSDLLNFPDIVKFECGKVPLPYNPKDKIQQGGLYWLRGSREHPASLYEAAYGQMAGAGATLIVVNPRKDSDVWFDAGEVPVPRKLVRSFLIKALGDGVLIDMIMPTLGGLTLKDIGELIRLTMARTGELTPHAVVATRRTCFNGLRGLTQVDTDQVHYDPPPFLAEWTAREKPFFLTAKDPRLVPRGLLFDGSPGTGKSAAAKYIADQFGVPLYRADVGGMKGKYVGESASSLSSVIGRIDREEPCVAPDTRITLADGARVTAEELYARSQSGESFTLKGVDPETGESNTIKLHRMLRKRGGPSRRVVTEKGTITVTEAHRFLVRRGTKLEWVQARDLKVGDDLVEDPDA
jgi:hypothetical protein